MPRCNIRLIAMRRLGLILVAIAIATIICIPIIPQSADAQSSQNLVVIKTDYQMLGTTELHGGGHLTYELRGTAARDLRMAVLEHFDTNGNGMIEAIDLELRAYIGQIETRLENPPLEFFSGYTISFAPLYKLESIDTSASGFTSIQDIRNDTYTPIRIFLYFNAGSYNIHTPYFLMMEEALINALFDSVDSDGTNTTYVNRNSYTYQYTHTDYRVGLSSFMSFNLNNGRMHVVRTPAGEISQYKATFQYSELPLMDSAAYKPFDLFENPQVQFVLVFICGYVMTTMPTRMYANYKFAYPRKFRNRAVKIGWLHITSKVLVILLIVLYFFPTMFASISPNIFISGIIIWILCIVFAVVFAAAAKVLYDRKIADISKEEIEATERRQVRKPAPAPVTKTPAGVNVVVQQPAQATPAPPPAKEKPTGPPCNVCHKPITDYVDLLKCKCGQLYHESCAQVAKHCTKCGNALVEIVPVGPAKKDVKCPTCGQMNSIEEEMDLLLVQCGKCGVIMEKVADGYNYLVVDNDHTTAFKMFVSLLKNGGTGLSISTTFPDKLKKEHDMEKADVIWLTDTTVADKKTINPHRLEFEMMRMYAAFVKSSPKSAIILDGFEYLVVENGFDKVFKFIKKINDLSSVNNATLIVPIGTSSLEPDQLGTLKKEFDKVIDLVSEGEE